MKSLFLFNRKRKLVIGFKNFQTTVGAPQPLSSTCFLRALDVKTILALAWLASTDNIQVILNNGQEMVIFLHHLHVYADVLLTPP